MNFSMVLKNSCLIINTSVCLFVFVFKNQLKGVNEAECRSTLRSILWYVKMPIIFVPLANWGAFPLLNAFVRVHIIASLRELPQGEVAITVLTT